MLKKCLLINILSYTSSKMEQPHVVHNSQFDGSWIGSYGPLNSAFVDQIFLPLDYFLWNEIREVVYETQDKYANDL